MLDRSHRLTRSADVEHAVRRGRRAGTSTLVLHLAEGRGAELGVPPRVGLVVGRAVGGAVIRNQVKRRIRHVVRLRIDRLPAGALLVVRALPPAATAPSDLLARDLDRALRRLPGVAL